MDSWILLCKLKLNNVKKLNKYKKSYFKKFFAQTE